MCHVVYIMHFMPSLADVAIGSNLATLNTLVFVLLLRAFYVQANGAHHQARVLDVLVVR